MEVSWSENTRKSDNLIAGTSQKGLISILPEAPPRATVGKDVLSTLLLQVVENPHILNGERDRRNPLEEIEDQKEEHDAPSGTADLLFKGIHRFSGELLLKEPEEVIHPGARDPEGEKKGHQADKSENRRDESNPKRGDANKIETEDEKNLVLFELHEFVRKNQAANDEDKKKRGTERSALKIEEAIEIQESSEQELSEEFLVFPKFLPTSATNPGFVLFENSKMKKTREDERIQNQLNDLFRLVDSFDHEHVENESAKEKADRKPMALS